MMRINENSVNFLKKYWSDELGISLPNISSNKVFVHSHGTLQGYWGIIFFKIGNTCIVSCPNKLVSEVKEKFETETSESIFSIERIKIIFDHKIERLIGPAWIGQISSSTFKPDRRNAEKLLSTEDWPAFEKFLGECDEMDVKFSDLEIGRPGTVGIYVENQIVAASGFKIKEGILAHIGVLAHPNFRGKGFATTAVSAATELALIQNLGIQYQTLEANTSSISLARKLGFIDFSRTIALRLKN